MNSGDQKTTQAINIDQYTDGDEAFKRELLLLMEDNLKEVQDAALAAMQTNTLEIFTKACHKIKPTLSMLDDSSLTESVDAVKAEFFNEEKKEKTICNFIFICNDFITRLRNAA